MPADTRTRKQPIDQKTRNHMGEISWALWTLAELVRERHRRTRSKSLRADLRSLEDWAREGMARLSAEMDHDDNIPGEEYPF